MAVNADTIRHLAKYILSCILLSLCSSGSRTWEEKFGSFPGSINGNVSDDVKNNGKDDKSSDVTSTVRWASVVILLSAAYYIQIQIWKKIWQRKQERGQRILRRSQYRQTRTTFVQTPSSGVANSRHGEQSRFGVNHGDQSRFNLEEEDDFDTDTLPPVSENEDVIEVATVVPNNVYYPELTMASVWTFVYGYGILLFVCIYCLAGTNIPSSCWWVMGMLALNFDELISTGLNRWYVCIILLNICVSVFSVWSAAMMDNEGNFIGELMFSKTSSLPLFDFIMGVVFPVSTPFIFFSIRSTVRGAVRDIYKLCEFALPFMTVLAICILVATSGICHVVDDKFKGSSNHYIGSTSMASKPLNTFTASPEGRYLGPRDSNNRRSQAKTAHSSTQNDKNASNGLHVETSARFSEEHPLILSVQYFKLSTDNNATRYTLLFLSPFAAFWLIRALIISIHTGHSTEFITAFILVNATRYGIMHQVSLWSTLSLSGAGLAFSMLIIGKRD
jgi:hypothetical protein